MPLSLPDLPYPTHALVPVLSSRTLELHHGRHQRGYVDSVNRLAAGTELAELRLSEMVTRTRGDADRVALFNAAAQAWNHEFYWRSLSPKLSSPSGRLRERIEADFGGWPQLRGALADAATGVFGSGWAWLALQAGKLVVLRTSNAETPLGTGTTPLLTLDVWEHAYYVDYENRRADYVAALLDRLPNWDFAAANFDLVHA